MLPDPVVKPAAPLGKGMLIAAWVCALVLLTFAFGKWQQQRDYPNREVASQVTDEEIIVTLRRNPAGHYIAAGRINGEPVQLLVDTGATMISVPESLMQRLQLERGPALLTSTAAGPAQIYATRIGRIELGPISLRDLRAGIDPRRRGEVLLGMNFLGPLEWSHRGDEMILKQKRR